MTEMSSERTVSNVMEKDRRRIKMRDEKPVEYTASASYSFSVEQAGFIQSLYLASEICLFFEDRLPREALLEIFRIETSKELWYKYKTVIANKLLIYYFSCVSFGAFIIWLSGALIINQNLTSAIVVFPTHIPIYRFPNHYHR